MRFLSAIFAAVLFLTLTAVAEDRVDPYTALLTPLLQGGTDVLGNPLVYPAGAPNVTAAIVTLPPGGETGWHRHDVPLFAYILEGALTVDYGEKGKKTYSAGESVLEAINWSHNGRNEGDVPMKLIAVYMGGGDAPNTVREPAP
jgi:quercetin dioxygenase-like cupin family protein